MDFNVISEISEAETIATGRGIRELRRITKAHGKGQWRKRKGIARVELSDGYDSRSRGPLV